MYIQRKRWRVSRRTFLQGVGVSLGLPWLEAMGVNSTSVVNAGVMTDAEIPRRAYFSNWGFFEAGAAVPKDTGLNYTLTPTLSSLAPYKKDFTLLSGMKAFDGGHQSHPCTLTGMNTQSNGLKLPSVDQQIADFHQGKTRVASLVLSQSRVPILSWSRNKTPVTPENSPKAVFDALFMTDDEKAKAAIRRGMADEQSVLDLVQVQASQLEKKLGKDDRVTLDQYFTSIREVEERIKIDGAWLDKPKPSVPPMDFGRTAPENLAMVNDDGAGMRNYLKLMFDIVALAFQNDSTRVVSHFPKGQDGPVFKDRTKSPFDYHNLSHHNNQEDKLRWWATVDQIYVEFWAYFLGKLKSVKEGNGTLLDHTMAAWATTNGASGHGRDNLPLMLAGGSALGLKHQGHIVKKGVMIGSAWETIVDRIGMPIPRDFQGGQTNGIIKELL